ncbi:DUF3822 family protein [Pontibacter sp. 172403-2]|uniref:DUF3822 family protein n=1 Tax=Pontibacter rufus TaxID=2791028 RepID=UPI0018AFA972|nr:DUF3822 family protein [Pontibacter sp. 172403-2]MBF9254296.1 DUF3822 family protein [Pontibacter sp. 172403-2]
MNTTSTYFRLSHKIQDEAFDLQQAPEYQLYLSLAQQSVRMAVIDAARNKFILLEDYELLTVLTPAQMAGQLRLLAAESPLLQLQSWQEIRVCISNQHFTLLPETLYDPAHQSDYLRLHSNLNPEQEVVLSYRHPGLEAINIFSVDAAVYQALQGIFQEQPLHLVHLTSTLIRSILHQAERHAPRSMYAFVESNYLTLLVAGPNGLEFCNIFRYHNPEDFIYYIVFVMQEQKLNPEQETITVWGDIMHDSQLFHILMRYVRHVKLGRRPTDVSYSYKFHDLFEHRYFDLYSLHLCE